VLLALAILAAIIARKDVVAMWPAAVENIALSPLITVAPVSTCWRDAAIRSGN
jgi:hypothetical protein